MSDGFILKDVEERPEFIFEEVSKISEHQYRWKNLTMKILASFSSDNRKKVVVNFEKEYLPKELKNLADSMKSFINRNKESFSHIRVTTKKNKLYLGKR